MPFRQGFKLTQKAYSEVDKEKWFRTWLVRQPDDGAHIIPFDTWYDELLKQSQSIATSQKKSNDDILAEIEDIRRRAVKQ